MVTTCGWWIFDSNCSHALPLTKEWLDFCCDNVTMSDEGNIEFLKVKQAIRFVPPIGMEKKMINLMGQTHMSPKDKEELAC